MYGRFRRFDLRYFVAVLYETFAHQLSDSSKNSVFLTYHYTHTVRIVNKNFRTLYRCAEMFVFSLCVERRIVYGAFFKMRSQHAVLILGIGESPQQAKSVQVLPERLLLVGVNPQSPRSVLCAYLRILQNATKTIQGSTYNVNTKISAQIKNVRKFLLTMRTVCV